VFVMTLIHCELHRRSVTVNFSRKRMFWRRKIFPSPKSRKR
jgi:hypothetical protein